MTNKTIGFIGGGRITRIFLEGWKRAGQLPGKVVVSDCNAETLAKLKARFPGVEAVAQSAVAAGRMMGDVGRYGNCFVAIIFFAVGLHLLGVIPMPLSGPGQVGIRRRGLLAAFILGLVFGVALGPCTFAYMAPMLGVTFKLAATNFLYGAALLLAYGVGHCAIIVAAGTSTELVQRFLNWNEQSRGVAVVKVICGVLVLLGGLWLVYSAP